MKKNFKILGFLFLVTCCFSACEKDKQIPQAAKEIEKEDPIIGNNPTVDPPDASVKDYLHVASFIQVSDFFTGGGAIDLATGNVYNQSNVVANLHNVDLVYLNYNNATDHNIALPTSKVLSVNEFGENVQYGWRLKNKGFLYRKTNLQSQDIEWFNNLKSASQIRNAVDSVVNAIGASNSIDRVKNVNKDQILFFKSLDRNVVSVVYVNSAIELTESSQMKFTIKSDASTLTTVSPTINSLKNANNYYADTLTFNFSTASNAEFFVDLKKKKIYTQSELDAMNDYSGVSILVLFNASTLRHYFMNAKASQIGTGGTSLHYGNNTLRDHLLARSDTREIKMQILYFTGGANNVTNYNNAPFETARLNNKALHTYWTSVFVSGHLWARENPNDNTVIRISDATGNNSWGVMKVVSVNKTSPLGEIKLAVKYYNSLD